MYSGPLYKSYQPCPWGPYGPRHGGVMGKTLKNLLLRNHKTQSFHILCVAMYRGHLYKSCQLCPWGPYRLTPVALLSAIDLQWKIHEQIFFSETTTAKASVFGMQHCYVELYINPAKHAPGVRDGPSPRVISSHRLTMEQT